jgi:hypothetical protein
MMVEVDIGGFHGEISVTMAPFLEVLKEGDASLNS